MGAVLALGQPVVRVRFAACGMGRTGRRPERGVAACRIDRGAFDVMRRMMIMKTDGKELCAENKKRRETEGDRPPPRSRSQDLRARRNNALLLPSPSHRTQPNAALSNLYTTLDVEVIPELWPSEMTAGM